MKKKKKNHPFELRRALLRTIAVFPTCSLRWATGVNLLFVGLRERAASAEEKKTGQICHDNYCKIIETIVNSRKLKTKFSRWWFNLGRSVDLETRNFRAARVNCSFWIIRRTRRWTSSAYVSRLHRISNCIWMSIVDRRISNNIITKQIKPLIVNILRYFHLSAGVWSCVQHENAWNRLLKVVISRQMGLYKNP